MRIFLGALSLNTLFFCVASILIKPACVIRAGDIFQNCEASSLDLRLNGFSILWELGHKRFQTARAEAFPREKYKS